MCVYPGPKAEGGSVSHGHLNCTLRNCQTGKVGCECRKAPVVAGVAFKCTCGNAAICDNNGRYDLAKIRARDPEWEQLILRGLKWQRLSWKVMLEKGAVVTIANALNIRNETAMEIGGIEIFKFMRSLCNPAPQPTPFEPVRNEVIAMYGSHGQDPHLLQAFQFIMEAGGLNSLLMDDYNKFLELFVDPKKRKLGFEAYKIIIGIPHCCPRLRLAVLMFTWRQPVNKSQWCASPPDISHRFNSDARTSWVEFMKELEATLSHLRYVVIGNVSSDSAVAEKNLSDGSAVAEKNLSDESAVAEKNVSDGSAVAEKKGTAAGSSKQQTQWMLELSCSVVGSLVAVKDSRKKTESDKQLVQFQEKLAKTIAVKVRTYDEHHWPECKDVGAALKSKMPQYRKVSKGEETKDLFWEMVTKNLYNDIKPASEVDKSKPTAAVAADLLPVASQMDDRGNMIGSHETVTIKGRSIVEEVEMPFRQWLDTRMVNEKAPDTARRVLQQCIFQVTQSMRLSKWPVRIVKRKNLLSVVAEEDLGAGDLILPLFCRRPTSILVDEEVREPLHKSIPVDVEWEEANISARAAAMGVETPIQHSITLRVNPELRLPLSNDSPGDWSGSEDLHPFWAVKRQKEGIEINSKIMRNIVELTTAFQLDELQRQGAKISGLEGVMIYCWYPFIVNTKPISKGDEVVLETFSDAPRKDMKRPREVNAYEQLRNKLRKGGTRK